MDILSNNTKNDTQLTVELQMWSSPEHLIVTLFILGLIILCTVIGNALVIAAIILDKNLHRVSNYLILSLAVTDGLVAAVVMPISAVNEVSQRWVFSSTICVTWISVDVLLCTASILTLVAISVDRYWAVTKIDYVRIRTSKRVFIMIAVVWITALTVSVPSIALSYNDNDPTKTGICMISQDHVYTIFSTVCSFYLPTTLILIVYANITFILRKRIRKKKSTLILKLEKQQSNKIPQQCNSRPEMTCLPKQTDKRSTSKSEKSDSSADIQYVKEGNENNEIKLPTSGGMTNKLSNSCDDILKAQKQKEKRNRRRERRVARTLMIITGAFIICWLPFFIIAIFAPFIRSKVNIPRLLESITLWLGYCNCLLNPLIYSLFNKEFRIAFKRLLSRKVFYSTQGSSDNTT